MNDRPLRTQPKGGQSTKISSSYAQDGRRIISLNLRDAHACFDLYGLKYVFDRSEDDYDIFEKNMVETAHGIEEFPKSTFKPSSQRLVVQSRTCHNLTRIFTT